MKNRVKVTLSKQYDTLSYVEYVRILSNKPFADRILYMGVIKKLSQ